MNLKPMTTNVPRETSNMVYCGEQTVDGVLVKYYQCGVCGILEEVIGNLEEVQEYHLHRGSNVFNTH